MKPVFIFAALFLSLSISAQEFRFFLDGENKDLEESFFNQGVANMAFYFDGRETLGPLGEFDYLDNSSFIRAKSEFATNTNRILVQGEYSMGFLEIGATGVYLDADRDQGFKEVLDPDLWGHSRLSGAHLSIRPTTNIRLGVYHTENLQIWHTADTGEGIYADYVLDIAESSYLAFSGEYGVCRFGGLNCKGRGDDESSYRARIQSLVAVSDSQYILGSAYLSESEDASLWGGKFGFFPSKKTQVTMKYERYTWGHPESEYQSNDILYVQSSGLQSIYSIGINHYFTDNFAVGLESGREYYDTNRLGRYESEGWDKFVSGKISLQF